jgi:hypothetical protein
MPWITFHFRNKREAEIESSGSGGRRGTDNLPASNPVVDRSTGWRFKKARPKTGIFAWSSGFGLLIDGALGDLG